MGDLNDPATRKFQMKRGNHENKNLGKQKITKEVSKQQEKQQSIKVNGDSPDHSSLAEQLDAFADLLIDNYLMKYHEKR